LVTREQSDSPTWKSGEGSSEERVGIGVPLSDICRLPNGEGGVTEGVVSATRIENVLDIAYICLGREGKSKQDTLSVER
jgi:hypothetical protein